MSEPAEAFQEVAVAQSVPESTAVTPWTRPARSRAGVRRGAQRPDVPVGSTHPGADDLKQPRPEAAGTQARSEQSLRSSTEAPPGPPPPQRAAPGEPVAAPADRAATGDPDIARNGSVTAAPEHEQPVVPRLDAETLSKIAPTVLSAMMIAPMLASALLGGGGGGDASANSVAASPNPNAAAALEALKLLREAYGSGRLSHTPSGAGSDGAGGGVENGESSSGTGATADALTATQRYQRSLRTALLDVDSQLAAHLRHLAGDHDIDRTALENLMRNLDTALVKVGPEALTPLGRRKVHDILTAALKRGQALVTGGRITAAETAAAIDQLTERYTNTLRGRGGQEHSAAQDNSVPAAAQMAVRTALSKLGRPYVWGASGKNSFDCSGLTHYAAQSAGVTIPRVARDQYRQLPKVVGRTHLRAGDLVFPDAQFNGGSPKHVMMYIGNGRCVEAPQPGGVVQVVKLPERFHATRWT